MKNFLAACLLFTVLPVFALIDQPNVLPFRGTGYHANGWFTYQTSIHSEGDGVLLDKAEKFILSPRYADPIRKVILKVQATVREPTRVLRLMPLVDGRELETDDLSCVVASVLKEKTFEFVRFDFNSSDAVDAFRLCLNGGSGNWRIGTIIVFYGEKDEDEDALLRTVAKELPTPSNLRATDFSQNSLSLAADAVEDADAYRFEVSRLYGTPQTELVEDFASAPNALSGGWSIAVSNNVKLSTYEMSDYLDTGAIDRKSLKIEISKSKEPVRLEIESTKCSAPVVECSFLCKVASTDQTDAFHVWGREESSSEWMELLSLVPVKTSKTNVTVRIGREKNIVQVRFGLTAEAGKYSTAALDSLRVVYGGDETREPVEGLEETYAKPECALAGLDVGRYGFRVQAVGRTSGDTAFRDSSWSAEQVIDLKWADLVVGAPQNVTTRVAGDRLTVSWDDVAGADHYLLDVVPEDDPESPLLSEQVVRATSETVVVPAVGSYTVRVKAVSPCAKSVATSEPVVGDVALGKLGNVKAIALDARTVVASWSEVPLAELYQVTLERISGDAERDVPDFSGIPESWPEGWSHYEFDEKYSKGPIPRMCYSESWITTRAYPRPVTEVEYKVKSLVTKKVYEGEIGKTFVVMLGSTSEEGEEWEKLTECPVTTAMQTLSEQIPSDRNVRRVKFAVDYRGRNPNYRNELNLEFKVLSVVFGEELRTNERSFSGTSVAATFGELDPCGRYRVAVAPQPSGDQTTASASAVVDLSAEHFRTTGVRTISSLRHGVYSEDFSSLSNVTAGTEARKVDLDYWQFAKGTGETGALLYNVNSNKSTSGGVYVCRDTSSDGADALMLGTLATGTMGCSVGLAFRNDTDAPVRLKSLAFDAVQRTLRANATTNVLEWLIADGAADICASSGWQEIAAARIVSKSAATTEEMPPFRQTFAVTEDLPPAIAPGGVLVLRWRHEKVTSGPLMAIDNVRLEFPDERQGCCLILK